MWYEVGRSSRPQACGVDARMAPNNRRSVWGAAMGPGESRGHPWGTRKRYEPCSECLTCSGRSHRGAKAAAIRLQTCDMDGPFPCSPGTMP